MVGAGVGSGSGSGSGVVSSRRGGEFGVRGFSAAWQQKVTLVAHRATTTVSVPSLTVAT